MKPKSRSQSRGGCDEGKRVCWRVGEKRFCLDTGKDTYLASSQRGGVEGRSGQRHSLTKLKKDKWAALTQGNRAPVVPGDPSYDGAVGTATMYSTYSK